VDPSTGHGQRIPVRNVVYSPDFHVNLISYGILRDNGIRWDEEKECLRDTSGTTIAVVQRCEDAKLWVFQKPSIEPQISLVMATHRRSAKPEVSEASLELWHRRMGHMHVETIKKAAELVNGVKINNSTTSVSGASPCSVCSQSDAFRQISRRPIGRTFGKYGQVHYDLVYFGQAINGTVG
jgi:hypothetical protein